MFHSLLNIKKKYALGEGLILLYYIFLYESSFFQEEAKKRKENIITQNDE